jgi:hypothetical protein
MTTRVPAGTIEQGPSASIPCGKKYYNAMADQLAVTPELLAYIRAVSLRDDEILRDRSCSASVSELLLVTGMGFGLFCLPGDTPGRGR